ncbi:MAG: transposase [Acidobacteriota bacterium]
MSLIDVTKQFPDEDACLLYMEKLRWPDAVCCPRCGSKMVAPSKRKKPSKNKRTRIYQCNDKACKHSFSATSGTMFHGSALPMTKWFQALAAVVNSPKSSTAAQLQEAAGVGSSRTAWYMARRIRTAMLKHPFFSS